MILPNNTPPPVIASIIRILALPVSFIFSIVSIVLAFFWQPEDISGRLILTLTIFIPVAVFVLSIRYIYRTIKYISFMKIFTASRDLEEGELEILYEFQDLLKERSTSSPVVQEFLDKYKDRNVSKILQISYELQQKLEKKKDELKEEEDEDT